MKYPFGIISDSHCHNFSAFSTVLPSGLNSRLKATLDEITRAGDKVLELGGDTLVHCGDLFHVRGSICPSVYNPTMEALKSLRDRGLNIILLAGNHDLESEFASYLHNASTGLVLGGAVMKTVTSYWRASNLHFLPWFEDLNELRAKVMDIIRVMDVSEQQLFLHAPMNGVIPGMPDLGLEVSEVMGWGFKRVFCGHYHNFKSFDDKVISVGATTHQTWGDIGSKAGFLIVHENEINHYPTLAPKFVQVNGEEFETIDSMELLERAANNFVRLTLNGTVSAEALVKCREYIESFGAKGVVIRAVKESTTSRPAGTVPKMGMSLEGSVEDWINKNKVGTHAAILKLATKMAVDAIAEVDE